MKKRKLRAALLAQETKLQEKDTALQVSTRRLDALMRQIAHMYYLSGAGRSYGSPEMEGFINGLFSLAKTNDAELMTLEFERGKRGGRPHSGISLNPEPAP